jgi:hypothetical protein
MTYVPKDPNDPNSSEHWQGSAKYLQVGPTAQHPDNGKDSVRAWTAPRDGKVRITSMLGDLTALPGSDGVEARIVRTGGTNVWPASGYALATPGHPVAFPALDVTVTANQTLYFHERQNVTTTNDTLQWVPQLTYL